MGDKAERAKALFLEGYNCTQAVGGAFAEEIGMDFDTAVRLASGFGGGMGRLRQVCGTVSGMVFVASAKLGYTDPKAKVEKKELYQEIQRLAECFRKENGSIVCAELLAGVKDADNSPVPSERTAEYYKKRPCPELAACAARILEDCEWIR